MRRTKPWTDRFWSKVDKTPGHGPFGTCWVWRKKSQASARGYGLFYKDGRMRPAHVVSYEDAVEPVPVGLQVDHICRVRACVNPAHLEPVTPRENVRRGVGPSAVNATKTHCPAGHAYVGTNLYTSSKGKRICKQCRADWQRIYNARAAA